LGQNDLEKIRVYFKYDEKFHDTGDRDKPLNIEKSFYYELFDISLITRDYQDRAKEYQRYIDEFIKNNLDALKNISASKDYSLLNPLLHKILDKYPYCTRVMIGYKWDLVYIVPKKIAENEYLTLNFENGHYGLVWWNSHYFQELWHTPPVFTLEGHTIDQRLNQDWWFYESDLKLVVVHKIKDEQGNYYGELELDFYKLDEFDKYFTPEGKPKLDAAQAFYDDQKKRYFEWLDSQGK
jgi:hypothetical protein